MKLRRPLPLILLATLLTFAAVYAADWTYNSSYYVTAGPIPQNAEIRIRVVAPGNSGNPKIAEFYGPSYVESQVRQEWTNVVSGQVLSFKLTKSMRIAVGVGGMNFWDKPQGISAREGFSQMRFDGGCVLDVKIVGQEF